jgi:hypothetical protein
VAAAGKLKPAAEADGYGMPLRNAGLVHGRSAGRPGRAPDRSRTSTSASSAKATGTRRKSNTQGSYQWQDWSYAWEATERGRHSLRARATDAAGNVQPEVPPWNPPRLRQQRHRGFLRRRTLTPATVIGKPTAESESLYSLANGKVEGGRLAQPHGRPGVVMRVRTSALIGRSWACSCPRWACCPRPPAKQPPLQEGKRWRRNLPSTAT